MGVTFSDPAALLLLPAALGIILLLHLGSRRRMGTFRQRASLIARTLVLAALVFALAGFEVVLPVDHLATVFVVDLSDSVGQQGRTESLDYVRASLAAMPKDDQAGIVAFGKDSLVDRLPVELRDLDAITSAPVRSATDIGGALRLAAALFPDDAQKRIVLLSDGNDTTGEGQAEAALAAAEGIQVQTHVIGLQGSAEVLVERLSTPTTAHLGESIDAVATITSTVAQPATVRLFGDGSLIGSQSLDLPAGQTTVTFHVKPQDAGFHVYRAVVDAGRDTFSQNNRADSDTIVKGEPRILLVAGDPAVGAQLVDALTTERQQVDTAIPEAMPADLPGLANYDSVVLVDVPRTRLTTAQMLALQTYVRDIGRGLVMVGGPDSYGAGGYTKTPIEESLPVDMGVRDRQKEPDIALVVVIDESGSMDACHCNTANRATGSAIAGVKKTDIGKEAILRAVSALTARDQLGVVAFNEAAHWAIHTAPLGSEGDVAGQLNIIQPGGQTNIYAGLDEAVKSLEGVTATRRHIILFTDGWSTSGAYDAIIARMKADGITLSTIGAGGGSAPVLADLAQRGGGRYYPAPNPQSIPDIFLKETQQVSGQQIVEETFHPIQTSDSPILRGISAGFPALLGYNGTTAKSAAQTVLVTARDDPLLAQWQYGLGRSVAWTSDATGHWAKDWIGWDGFSRFFSQLVGWTFPGEETGGIEARFDTHGGTTTLHVESVAADGSPRDFYSTTATIVAPDLTSSQVVLPQVAPGVYETSIGELDPGAYAIRLNQVKPGTSPLGRTVGLVAPTAAEYRSIGPNQPLLAAIRAATGGRVVDDPVAVWKHDLATTSTFTDLWPALLVLAMLLWPLDIALRRVSVGRRELVAARAWVRGIPARRRRAAPRTAQIEGLIAARDRATSVVVRAALREPASPDVARLALPGMREVAAPSAAPIAEARQARPPGPEPAALPRSSPAIPPPPPAPGQEADVMARLREAKRRSRDR